MSEQERIKSLVVENQELRSKLRSQADQLIDDVTMQAIVLTLLKFHRSKGSIKPAALNDIRFAQEQWRSGDYSPKQQLERILDTTIMDKEIRKDTPR